MIAKRNHYSCDKNRVSERIRGRAGVKLRRERLGREPLCRMCKAKGKITQATVPDHIIPLAFGGTDVDENIRCLCAGCHLIATAEQFGLKAPKKRIDRDGWPIT